MAKSQKHYVEQQKLDITQYILYNFTDANLQWQKEKNGDRKNWKGNVLYFDWDSGFKRIYIC